MYNIDALDEDALIQHTSRFAQAVTRVLYDLCGVQFSYGQCHKSNSQEVISKELTVFTYFTGTVQGTYTLNIPTTVANELLQISEPIKGVRDLAQGLFEEVVNVAVGQSIEQLKDKFGFLTFNPPVVALGEILFPSYRNSSIILQSEYGEISINFSINMANLEITDKLMSTMKNLKKQQSVNFQDALTGVYNRAYLEYFKKKLFGKRRPISFVIFDVDKFKDVNDNHGHSSGDLALQHIADKLKANVRDDDIAIRFGGDEFIIILADSPVIGALRLTERIAADLKSNPLIFDDGFQYEITISAGITEYVKNESFEEMFKRADDNLYKAKEAGRNQICGQ